MITILPCHLNYQLLAWGDRLLKRKGRRKKGGEVECGPKEGEKKGLLSTKEWGKNNKKKPKLCPLFILI
jgi:hypothetical protein